MTVATQLRIPADVHWRRFDTELVVLDLRKGEYYAFSRVAADVFEGLARGDGLDHIKGIVHRNYEVALETVQEDIDRLVDELCQRGLLEGDPGSAVE